MKNKLKMEMLEAIFIKTGGRPENPKIAEVCAEIAVKFFSANAVLAVSLPMLKLEYHEIKSDTAYGKFDSWTAELVGVKEMVAESGTKGGAIKELMKSIEIKLLYGMEHRQ